MVGIIDADAGSECIAGASVTGTTTVGWVLSVESDAVMVG